MKFKIGDIVKHDYDTGLIVLATRQTDLTIDTLRAISQKGVLKIINIDALASNNMKVEQKDYKVGKIKSFDEEGWATLDPSFLFKEYFEDDIYF